MPIVKLVLVRKRPDISYEAFRQGYETSHSRIAVKLFGHLWLSYRRHYLTQGRNFLSGSLDDAPATGFDAISEYVLRDEAALTEMERIGLANFAMIKADEALWFDQQHSWIFSTETMIEPLPG